MLILLGLVLYEYVYLNVRSELTALKDQQDVKMKTLKRSIALIEQKPELEKQLAALREEAKAQNVKMIDGEPISIAAANLQGMVKGVITGRSGTVSSERIGKPEELDKSAQAETPGAVEKGQPAARTKPSGIKKPAQAGKEAEGGRLKVITVILDATLPDAAALSDLLYSLETRTPYLALRELDVRVKNFKDPRELMLRLDVSGIYGGK